MIESLKTIIWSNKKCIVLLQVCLLSFSVHGQVLEEIIVTAQKREQSIQDVGIAITAFSGDQLEALGYESTTDIIRMIPGVTVGGANGGQLLTVNIRGVSQNDFADFAEPPNAIYVDEAYVSAPALQKFAMLDVDRVEVLKGPQGTLFGRNATGGLVHYISRKPTYEFEAYADATYGSYNQTRFEGAISGPMSENFNGRLALLYNRHDEILENQLNADDEWGDDTFVGRGQIDWAINDNADLLLNLYGGRSILSSGQYQNEPLIPIFDADGNVIDTQPASPTETRAGIGPGGVDTCPGCFFEGPRPVPGGDGFGYLDPDGDGLDVSKDAADNNNATHSIYGTTAKLTWDLGNMILTSITDFKQMEKENGGLDVEASPVNAMVFHADVENDQFSQELRLHGDLENTRWLLGAYYLNIDALSIQGISGPPTVSGPNLDFGFLAGLQYFNTVTLETESYSVFGQLEYDLKESLTLVTGLRAIYEAKDFTHRADIFAAPGNDIYAIPDGTLVEADFQGGGIPNNQDLSSSDTEWSGKIQLNWKPNEDVLVYGGINRGVKAGGFNQQLAGLFGVKQFEYDPEILITYEIGFKSTLLDEKVRFNGSAYYYSYKDYQAFQVDQLSFTIINLDANYKGLEFEIVAQPSDNFETALSISYIDAEVQDVPFASGPGGAGIALLDREPTFTPEVQLAGLARYTWPNVWDGSLAIQADVNYSDSSFYNLTNYGGAKLDSYVLGNVRLSYRTSNGTWETDVFVKNIGDERNGMVGFDFADFCGCRQFGHGEPRWAGISVKRNWN